MLVTLTIFGLAISSLISVNLFSNQPPKTIAIAIAFPVVATGLPPVVISPSTAKLSTAVTAVSIVVVVPLTVRSPVTVRAPPTVPSLVTTSVPIVPVISPNDVEPETFSVPVVIIPHGLLRLAPPVTLNVPVAVTSPVIAAPCEKVATPLTTVLDKVVVPLTV